MRLQLPDLRSVRSRLFAAPAIAGLLLCLAPGAKATAIYQYVGNNFTNVQAPYTTSMFISGTLTLSAPLGPNFAYSDVSALVVAFSFNDGVNTLSSPGLATILSGFGSMQTDAGGNVTDWSLIFAQPPEFISTISTSSMVDDGTTARGIHAHNNDHPGVWTLVPEPSALLLMSCGLGGLTVIGSRRRY